MIKRLALVSFIALMAAGCAQNQRLYQWGQYEETLFVNYHEPEQKQQALENYLSFVEKHDAEPPLAPGLYAEAGTFMLEQGDSEKAVYFYRLERDTWPESQAMMDALISNLEARQ